MKNPNRFWNWFQDNHHTFKKILLQNSSVQKESMYYIKKNLGYYSSALNYFLIIPQCDKDKFEIVFTSTGDANQFINLFALLDNAPALRSWKFTAMMVTEVQITQTISRITKPYILRDITMQNSEEVFLSLDKTTCLADTIINLTLKTHTIICNFEQLDQVIYNMLNNSLTASVDSTNLKLVQHPTVKDQQLNKVFLSELSHYIDSINALT